MRILLRLMMLLLLSTAAFPGDGQEKPAAPKKVLFIGNSLTQGNDLPAMVEALSRAPGRQPLQCKSETMGGFSLEDHWKAGRIQQIIARGGWDYVVLQQGPSSLPESRVNLRVYVKLFATAIRKAKATPALYMVWPDRTRFRFFDDVRDSYRIAAEDVKGIFLPAGEAWRAAWKKDPNLPLYGPDAFHPTEAGTYAAALVIYAGLTDDKPTGLPNELTLEAARGRRVQIPKALALALQNASAEVLKQEPGSEKSKRP